MSFLTMLRFSPLTRTKYAPWARPLTSTLLVQSPSHDMESLATTRPFMSTMVMLTSPFTPLTAIVVTSLAGFG